MKTSILNLIYPERSDISIEIFKFPDGEPHIRLGEFDRKNEVLVKCRVSNPDDLFILLQVGNILSRSGVVYRVEIYYLMSARMDRVISYSEAFSLEIVTRMISSLGYESVSVLEPHSERTAKLLARYDRSRFGPSLSMVTNDFIIVFPDEGAYDRYGSVLPKDSKVLLCRKTRDLETGQLTGFELINPEVINDNPGIPLKVIDDLCDGGGTFAGIANLLAKYAPNRERHIQVVHMVNPKGIETLAKNYDKVIFTNSYKNYDPSELPGNVKVIDINL